MDLAIKKAKEVGIGWVTCTGQEDSLTFMLHVNHNTLAI